MTHTTTQDCQGMILPVGSFFQRCRQGAHRATMKMRAPHPALAHCTYPPERRMVLKCKPPHAAGVVTGSTIFQDSQDRSASNLIRACLLELSNGRAEPRKWLHTKIAAPWHRDDALLAADYRTKCKAGTSGSKSGPAQTHCQRYQKAGREHRPL